MCVYTRVAQKRKQTVKRSFLISSFFFTPMQDPMSHRIIEKRRRDRMNNCLADLSRLIPTEYMKKGRGRVEKTEIIEMAIKHMKYLQDRVSSSGEAFLVPTTNGFCNTFLFPQVHISRPKWKNLPNKPKF